MEEPTSVRFEMRAPTQWMKKLDEWRRQQPDLPPRAEAIRRLVEAGLQPSRAPVTGGAGVAPDMIVQATRIVFESVAKDDPSVGTWGEFIDRAQSKRYHRSWVEMVPDDVRADAYDFLEGEDRQLVERVAGVVSAARLPPPS